MPSMAFFSTAHAELSGHLGSTCCGLCLARHKTAPTPATMMAAALAIGAMHYLPCIQPSGDSTPRLSGVGARLPVCKTAGAWLAESKTAWSVEKRMSENEKTRKPEREDYERALQSMGSLIDVEVNDLMTLAERAQYFADQRAADSLTVSQIMSRPAPGHASAGQRSDGSPV